MRLKIGTRIGIGFGILTLAVIVNSLLTAKSLNESREINEKITSVYNPSLDLINKLSTDISDTRMLIKSWVHIDKKSDTPDKIRLRNIYNSVLPSVFDSLTVLSQNWSADHKTLLKDIQATVNDTLFPKHQYIMDQLSDFESYEDPFIVFETTMLVEEDGGEIMNITESVLAKIDKLKAEQENQVLLGQTQMVASFEQFRKFIIIMLFGLIIVAVFIASITIRSLTNPINTTKNILNTLSKGIIPDVALKTGKDELGQMGHALNQVIQALRNISAFTLQIGKGNFNSEYQLLSDEDHIGQSLLQMREELQKAKKEEEKRQEEVKQRNWASQGVALFSDILRQNNDNLEALSYEIISNMVQYTNSNQGGIFIVNDNDPRNLFLEMKACYAFDRQKFLKKTIEVGEGLVGRCYQEKEKIYLTDIPSDYIKITSGLGEENPRSLLLIPLTYNNKIFGIIEIASFNEYASFEVEFIERIGESIAATISSVKSNIQTSILLEQTQQQAEEMHSQEEEMRQNMEELRATQEQSSRREEELVLEVETLKRRLRELQSSN